MPTLADLHIQMWLQGLDLKQKLWGFWEDLEKTVGILGGDWGCWEDLEKTRDAGKIWRRL